MAISNQMCGPDDPNGPKWSTWQLLRWKLLPQSLGGGWSPVSQFKFAWVAYHRDQIRSAAAAEGIPNILLGGVSWIEVGGDPLFIDDAAFYVRSFDWSGPLWVDRNLTITRQPQLTSFGNVSIQLRRVMEVLNITPGSISFSDKEKIVSCLYHDAFNISIVAKYLRRMINIDWPTFRGGNASDDQVAVAATRYNRGPDLSITQIRQNMSYGNVVLKIAPKIAVILGL